MGGVPVSPRLRDRVCSRPRAAGGREPLGGLCMWLTTASMVGLSTAAAPSMADRAAFSTAHLGVSTAVLLALSTELSTALVQVVGRRFITIAPPALRVVMRPTTVGLLPPRPPTTAALAA